MAETKKRQKKACILRRESQQRLAKRKKKEEMMNASLRVTRRGVEIQDCAKEICIPRKRPQRSSVRENGTHRQTQHYPSPEHPHERNTDLEWPISGP